jgi:hypothetical protein
MNFRGDEFPSRFRGDHFRVIPDMNIHELGRLAVVSNGRLHRHGKRIVFVVAPVERCDAVPANRDDAAERSSSPHRSK